MSKCRNCGRTFLCGDYIIYNALGCYCADRKNCFEKRKTISKIHICKCEMSLGIGNILDARTIIYKGKYMCTNCFQERKNMPNIKITAEVNGKIVPLNTISTESFEAIKALEKPKEIPVARVGNWPGDPGDRRLFLKITDSIRNRVTDKNVKVIAIELKGGNVVNSWAETQCELTFRVDGDSYENIKPL